MSVLSLGTCLSNLKSVALTVLELSEFHAQTFRGHVTLATRLFKKLFLRGYFWTVPENMLVKFEVRSFSRYGAIIDRSAAHRHTDTHTQQTSNENSISSVFHSIHLAILEL